VQCRGASLTKRALDIMQRDQFSWSRMSPTVARPCSITSEPDVTPGPPFLEDLLAATLVPGHIERDGNKRRRRPPAYAAANCWGVRWIKPLGLQFQMDWVGWVTALS
jgi:hypothetical protein